MGVRGLTSYVRETLTWEREEEVLPRGSILLVDGKGWGWSLLENKVRVDRDRFCSFFGSVTSSCCFLRHGQHTVPSLPSHSVRPPHPTPMQHAASGGAS